MMMMMHKLIFKLFNPKKDFKLSLSCIFHLELLLEAVLTFLGGGSLEDLRRENTLLVVKEAEK